MTIDIETFLQQSLPTIEDNNFSQSVITNLMVKQQKYLKLRQIIIALSILFCAFVMAVVYAYIGTQFTLANKLIDLSSLFLDSNSVYITSAILIFIVFYITSETFEGC